MSCNSAQSSTFPVAEITEIQTQAESFNDILCYSQNENKGTNTLTGSLLFGHPESNIGFSGAYRTIEALNFPSLENVSFLVAGENTFFYDPIISLNRNLLAVIRIKDNGIFIAIEVYSSKGNLVNSIPWQTERWRGRIQWIDHENLATFGIEEGVLDIINVHTSNTKTIQANVPISDFYIRGFNSGLNQFAIGHIDSDDQRLYDYTFIWDTITNNIVWQTTQFQNAREIRWADDGNRLAILLPNQILFLKKDGQLEKSFEIKPAIFAEGIQWSFDNKKLYFWGTDTDLKASQDLSLTYEDTGTFLYHYDLLTKQVEKYCYSILYRGAINNDAPPVSLISLSPDYFFIENTKKYNFSSQIYENEILLIDTLSKDSFYVTNNTTLIGWFSLAPEK